MSVAKDKPYHATPTDYEDDFHAWAFEQAALMRLRRFSELDLTNLVEEVESIGREQRHALESCYRVLIFHLLKWQFSTREAFPFVDEHNHPRARQRRSPRGNQSQSTR